MRFIHVKDVHIMQLMQRPQNSAGIPAASILAKDFERPYGIDSTDVGLFTEEMQERVNPAIELGGDDTLSKISNS